MKAYKLNNNTLKIISNLSQNYKRDETRANMHMQVHAELTGVNLNTQLTCTDGHTLVRLTINDLELARMIQNHENDSLLLSTDTRFKITKTDAAYNSVVRIADDRTILTHFGNMYISNREFPKAETIIPTKSPDKLNFVNIGLNVEYINTIYKCAKLLDSGIKSQQMIFNFGSNDLQPIKITLNKLDNFMALLMPFKQ